MTLQGVSYRALEVGAGSGGDGRGEAKRGHVRPRCAKLMALLLFLLDVSLRMLVPSLSWYEPKFDRISMGTQTNAVSFVSAGVDFIEGQEPDGVNMKHMAPMFGDVLPGAEQRDANMARFKQMRAEPKFAKRRGPPIKKASGDMMLFMRCARTRVFVCLAHPCFLEK